MVARRWPGRHGRDHPTPQEGDPRRRARRLASPSGGRAVFTRRVPLEPLAEAALDGLVLGARFAFEALAEPAAPALAGRLLGHSVFEAPDAALGRRARPTTEALVETAGRL